MDFSIILIIIFIILSLITYCKLGGSSSNNSSRNNYTKERSNNFLEKAKDIKNYPINLKADNKNNNNKTVTGSETSETDKKIEDTPQYYMQIKSKKELTKLELQTLENQYNEFLCKKGGESYHQSLKDNSRICMVYEKNSSKPIAQASILVLDTHDFWGAFSKIRNLNLDTHSVILYNVCVEKEHRCRGICQQMLLSIHHWCSLNNKPNIVLFVNPTNTHAIRLYEKIGYSVDKSHYAPNGTEILMRTKISML